MTWGGAPTKTSFSSFWLYAGRRLFLVGIVRLTRYPLFSFINAYLHIYFRGPSPCVIACIFVLCLFVSCSLWLAFSLVSYRAVILSFFFLPRYFFFCHCHLIHVTRLFSLPLLHSHPAIIVHTLNTALVCTFRVIFTTLSAQ